MFNRKYKLTENFQDKIARLYGNQLQLPVITESETGAADTRKHLTRTITFQVTDACNLRCTYCYQIKKQEHYMSFDIAKAYTDFLLEATSDEDNDYINQALSPGLIVEFIGGEPFLAIDLITEITDYILDKMIEMNHPWLNKFMVSICSNGVMYFDPRVQSYIQKHKHYLSFSVSIDGNKKLHDACRIFPDGSGSYDIAIQAVNHYREVHGGYMGSKMTLAPQNIAYASDAVFNLLELKYTEIFLNCVYEEGWQPSDATILYNQLVKIADYLIDNDLFDKVYLSIFEDIFFKPKLPSDNDNWCGGTGSMLSCDWKGDLYPCIRYMESSLGDDVAPMIIGNVYEGIMKTEPQQKCVECLRKIDRRTQSTDECFYCPIAEGCSWCSAYNYQEFGTADKRATYICIMHKARALANAYYWNKGFRKHSPFFRMKINIPDEWALEIINKEELDMLYKLESFTDDDYNDVLSHSDDKEYAQYVYKCIDTHAPVYTNKTPKYDKDDPTVKAILENIREVCNKICYEFGSELTNSDLSDIITGGERSVDDNVEGNS